MAAVACGYGGGLAWAHMYKFNVNAASASQIAAADDVGPKYADDFLRLMPEDGYTGWEQVRDIVPGIGDQRAKAIARIGYFGSK